MRQVAPTLLCAAALALGVTVVVGCGDSDDELPENAVAKVGDTVITKADYDKWHRLVALSPFLRGQGDEAFKRETMQTLIESAWVQREAAAQGITVSDEAVKREYEARKNRSPNDKARRQVLEDARLTEDDLLYRAKIDRLRQKLEQRIVAKAPKVSDEEIATYYRKNKKRFVRPERRELTLVLTKTEAKADQAKQAVQGGESWKAVVKRYSIAPKNSTATAIRGPKLEEGREALERAIYRTGTGEINGPVKTRFGWYVFEVTKVRPEVQFSLADVEQTISSLLHGRRRVAALKSFRNDYRSRTVCADRFKVPECRNGPEEKSS